MVLPKRIELPTSHLPIMFYVTKQFIYQSVGFIKFIFNIIIETEYYLVEIDS